MLYIVTSCILTSLAIWRTPESTPNRLSPINSSSHAIDLIVLQKLYRCRGWGRTLAKPRSGEGKGMGRQPKSLIICWTIAASGTPSAAWLIRPVFSSDTKRTTLSAAILICRPPMRVEQVFPREIEGELQYLFVNHSQTSAGWVSNSCPREVQTSFRYHALSLSLIMIHWVLVVSFLFFFEHGAYAPWQ